jgi:uncharacterized membrane protein
MYTYNLREIMKYLAGLFILVGVVVMFFKTRGDMIGGTEFFLISLSSFLILSLTLIMPFMSIDYELVRVYQQTLIILSFCAVFGLLSLFSFLKENKRIFLLAVFFIVYFLFLSKFNNQIVGGPDISKNLNNIGLEYNAYYVHDSEVVAGDWFFDNYPGNILIYLDNHAYNKILTPDIILSNKIIKDVLPSVIDKKSYVYASQTNTVKSLTFKSYQGNLLSFNFPNEFLEENKNKIYSNGGSEIFK